MGFTIDIDTGGTFTDGLFTNGAEIKRVKVDSTPHDLTVSWLKCMEEGAEKCGFSYLPDFLEEVDIVRWSNTVASNVIAERKGPKMGLFVTEGNKQTLYSTSGENPVLGHLIEAGNIDTVSQPVNTEELLIKLKELLEGGVRRICISLKDALKNEDEATIKDIIEEQFPDHYLGHVPLLLGGDICKHPDDMTRTHKALLNSYVHGPLAQSMYKAEDELRNRGFLKPLLLGHTDGGVTRVSKTKPVDTIESGPIFGIHAGDYWANVYDFSQVITLDVGGTTSKIALMENFRPAMTRNPDLLGVPLKQSMLNLKSIALGGGTVAKVVDGKLQLGPESMGAFPGPACYDLGGTEATLTDACLVSGYLNADYFFGGNKEIRQEQAEKIIQENVANPLGISLEIAANEIINQATAMVAEEVSGLVKQTGKAASEFVLFAFGGNGAVLGCEVADKSGLNKSHVFSLGSVLSTFGSSVADVSHTYEYSPFAPVKEHDALAEIAEEMLQEAKRDMEGEGFDLTNMKSELDFILYNKQDAENVIQFSSQTWQESDLAEKSMSDLISESFVDAGRDSASADLVVEVLRLRAKSPVTKVNPQKTSLNGENSEAALKGERNICRGTEKAISKIYEWDKLQAGNVVAGPAVLEGSDTTYVVPQYWRLTIDSYGNGAMERN
jgi:N-methylhydantoinase A/oxoprolinase/acetone carboxylase beta subunit|tara:strand:- start:6285 stop:8285 length:2001 start_codon:yes stop_codon:yes gene_type:complete